MAYNSASSKTKTLKFLCCYGGKIIPRKIDGNLRYVGGFTRILAVDRSITFAELMVKLAEFCGFSVNLKCFLPGGEFDTLISIKSDEDLKNLLEEYDRASSSLPHPLKVKAVLTPTTPTVKPLKFQIQKKVSALPSPSPFFPTSRIVPMSIVSQKLVAPTVYPPHRQIFYHPSDLIPAAPKGFQANTYYTSQPMPAPTTTLPLLRPVPERACLHCGCCRCDQTGSIQQWRRPFQNIY